MTNNGGQVTFLVSSITTNGDILELSLPENSASAKVTVAGTWTGTLQFEQTNDGGLTWVASSGIPQPSGAGVTSTTANGQWAFAVGALTNFRVRASASVTGTSTITITNSLAAPQAGTGGTKLLATTTLSSSQLKEFNAVDVLTAAGTASGGNTVYTGTIPNGAANALVGGWYTVAGFTTGANNGNFKCVASSATTLTLANAAGVLEVHAGTATNLGFTIFTAGGASVANMFDKFILQYKYNSIAFTVGNADNIFIPFYEPSNTALTEGSGSPVGFMDQTANMVDQEPYEAGIFITQANAANQDIILTISGTTPGLPTGNGSLLVTCLVDALTLQ